MSRDDEFLPMGPEVEPEQQLELDLLHASAAVRIATGARTGKLVRRVGNRMLARRRQPAERRRPMQARSGGFDLHARVRVSKKQRGRLEKLPQRSHRWPFERIGDRGYVQARTAAHRLHWLPTRCWLPLSCFLCGLGSQAFPWGRGRVERADARRTLGRLELESVASQLRGWGLASPSRTSRKPVGRLGCGESPDVSLAEERGAVFGAKTPALGR